MPDNDSNNGEKDTPKKPNRTRLIIGILIVLLVVTALIFIALNYKESSQIVRKANWYYSLGALAFTAISYLCLSYTYASVNKGFEVKVGWLELINIGYISAALGSLMALWGAEGHFIRITFLSRRGIATGKIFAASIFHSYINNLMTLVTLSIGVIWVQINHVPGAHNFALVALSIVLSLLFLTAILLFSSVRAILIKLFNTVWHLITHRTSTKFLADFDKSLSNGITLLRFQKLRLAVLLLLLEAAWIFAGLAVWFCFRALGQAPNLGIVLTGFAIGVTVGNISLIPGGIGVTEASMASVYAVLGIPVVQGLVAAILFRVIYDIIPFLVSLGFYVFLFKRFKKPS